MKTMKGSEITTPGAYWCFDESAYPTPRWRIVEIVADEPQLSILWPGSDAYEDLSSLSTEEFVGPIEPPTPVPVPPSVDPIKPLMTSDAALGSRILEWPAVRRLNLESCNDMVFPQKSARRVCQFDVLLSSESHPLQVQITGEPIPSHPELLPDFLRLLAEVLEGTTPRNVTLRPERESLRLSLTTSVEPNNMPIDALLIGIDVPTEEAAIPALLRKIAAVVDGWLAEAAWK